MQRKLYKKEERGLKGGPNYQVSEMMGSVTSTGYWPDSPDRNNDFNIIPSNEITMEGMDMPLMGMDDLGNTQYMTPGNNYTFPGSYVTETPIAKKGGMFLGHYTFKDGGLVRMQPGGTSKERQEKIQKDVNSTAYQATTADWDPHGTNGAPQEPLEYDKKTGKYYTRYYDAASGQYIRQEAKVEVKPKSYGVPAKNAPKKTKDQIEKEKAEKFNKKTQADPTLWLQEHPEFMLDENGAPVLRSSMQENAPADYLAAEQKNLKEKFIKEQNADPLQKSLGTVTDENPQTREASERFANTELAGPLLEKNPRDKYATRAEWIESFTPQERAIIQGSNKAYEFDPSLGTTFARALQTEGNKNESWQRNLDLTEEEKNRPVTKMDRLGLFAPLAYPVNVMTGAMTGDFGDAAKGYTPKPLFGDDNTMRDYYQHDAQTMGNALFQAGIDPLNYIGAGLLQDAGASTNIFKGLQKLPDGTVSNLNRGAKPLTAENNLSNALQGTGSLFSQVKGELLQGSRNRKAIAEGNEWLSNWINHPTTQGKIDADMGNEINQFIKYYAGDDLDKQIEVLNLMKNQSKNFKPNSKEYPLFRQIIDNIDQYYGQKIEPIHDGNWGVSYQHGIHPVTRQGFEWGTKTPHDRYGSWISRTVDLPQAKRSSTAVHEGTHDWVSDLALTHSGLRNKMFANMNPTIKADYIQWKNLRSQGIDPETVMGKQRAYMAYLGNPTEQHARIMELRKGLGLKPNEVVTPDYAKEIGDWIDSGGSGIDPRFLDVIDRDPKKLANLFNELWVAVPAVGVGAAALQQEKKGGGIYLGAYKQVGGQLVAHDISVPSLSRQEGGPTYDIPTEPYRAPNIVKQEGREHYDPVTETIYMQPSYPNVIHEQMVKSHELDHHNQKLKGKLSSTEYWPGPLKEPAVGSTDDMIYPYYNRTTQDVYNLMNSVPQSTFFGIPEDIAVMGFQNKTYDTPGTAEYEAEHPDTPRTFYRGKPVVKNAIAKTLSREEKDPEMMFRDKYNTELTKEEQKEFDKWAKEESKKLGRDILMDKGAYDVQGFWKSGDWKNRDADNHGTDTWKKPNHPTFSNQSKYHGAGGLYGGNWTEDAGYQPSKQSLNNYGPDYYNWIFGEEPNRPEHLDMSRYDGTNSPTPVVYKKGGSVKKVKIKSLPKNWKSQ